MATQVIYQKISDITGDVVESEEELITIEVEHPEFPEIIRLDATTADVAGKLPEPQEFVSLTINGQRHLLSIPEFNDLFEGRNPDEIMTRAFEEQQEERRQQQAEKSRGRGRRGRLAGPGKQVRVNWASPDRAGQPHPGRVSPAEQEYVRDHLDEVNARLREEGQREIDPDDPKFAKRYGWDNS